MFYKIGHSSIDGFCVLLSDFVALSFWHGNRVEVYSPNGMCNFELTPPTIPGRILLNIFCCYFIVSLRTKAKDLSCCCCSCWIWKPQLCFTASVTRFGEILAKFHESLASLFSIWRNISLLCLFFAIEQISFLLMVKYWLINCSRHIVAPDYFWQKSSML